ncbi:probable disease resistance RPP8-like protein 2 [Pyrus communis]|uniref:probable disease resistance RPP8-like protein 2 n=1 Tax=Pyrus communis TaxID=23211 RepID=UPI0035BFA39D
MADAVVFMVLERLTDSIIPELKLLGGVGDQVELAQTKLQFMQGYLKDADARHGHDDDGVRTWVASVRDAAYDLEDVAEAFVLKVASKRKGSVLKSRSFPHAIEPSVVGCADGIEILVAHLIKEKHHRVVSIWGMGGLGKTTLAKQVYNHDGVRCHFDCFAWVCISQQCHGREVLEELLNQLSSTNEERQEIAILNEDEIAKRLCTKQQERKCLVVQERKCLVVLDDIWTCDVWNSLQAGFPMNEEIESRILLTTRNKEVAYCADENGFIYQPLSLNEDESWELFEKITMFQMEDTNPEIYAKKKDLGMKMPRHCEGLPLAITVLGGLLSRKDSVDECDMVHMNFYAHIRRGTNLGPEYEGEEYGGVLWLLALSYDNLPYQLKLCFLYLAHFPKDYEIPVNRLTQLWMAEGFVSTTMEKMEDASYRCLSELVERSMVQVGQHGLTRKIKTCCLHGLMRDLCMVKAKERNILRIINYSAATVTKETPSGRVQRLAINLENELDFYYLNRDERDRHLRSMPFFVPKQFILNLNFGQRVLRSVLNSYKLLRVLKFEDIFMRRSFKLPGEIGNLVHLRFLSLRNTKMQELPSSVGNLVCLQTLDLRGTDTHAGLLLKVPNVFWKMEKLRHVYLPSIIRGGERLSFATHASNLQTMVNVSVSASDLYDFVNLTDLQRLEVTLFGNETIEKGSLTFDNLQSLSTTSFHDGAWNLVLSYPRIYKLRVKGRIRQLPEDLMLLPNLTKLTLCGIHHDRLKDDNIEILEKLPSLRMLFLDHNAALGYFPGPLVCSAGGFPRLEFLSLHSLIELKEWRVEK